MWWSRGTDADAAARAGERLARLTSARTATQAAPAAREPTGGWVPGPPAPLEDPPVGGTLPGPAPLRLDPGRRGVGVLVVVAVVAALLGGWYLWRSRPVAQAIPPAVSASPSAAPAGSPSPSLVVVDVSGKVAKPGLVRLPKGSRVADAIAAAGGARPGTDLSSLNLARKVVDGEQVAVGVPAAAGGSQGGSSANAAGPLDLNSATAAQLSTLPGIGDVLAQRIVDWRTQHGGFRSVNDLRNVSGIGDRKFDELKSKVRV